MRHDLYGTASRQANLGAAALLAAVLTQLLLAQLTLALAACLVLAGRLVRWRPIWLAVPAAVGLALVLSVGPGRSVAGYLAFGADLARHLGARGPAQARIAGLRGVFWRWDRWLPRQFPVAVLAASGEAALLAARARGDRSYRSGVVALARRRYLTATLRRGEVSTADGGCVGVEPATGRRVTISWREAEGGVLCTGVDAAAVTATALELAVAAIQHRKAVMAIDLGSGAPGGLAGPLGTACAASGARLVLMAPVAGRGVDDPQRVIASALARREVVLFAPRGTASGDVPLPMARRVLAGLLASLRRRADLGAPADCLVWLSGCEAADPRLLGDLLATGGRAGTAVLLSTTADPVVARLAGQVNALLVRGPAPPGLAPGRPASAAPRLPSARAVGATGCPDVPESLLLEQHADALALYARNAGPQVDARGQRRQSAPRLLTGGRATS
jgi:hypothetical protein